MYASLVTAGVSALYDLYKSATETSKTGGTAAAFPAQTATETTEAAAPANVGGSKFTDSLHKLFTDIQAGTSSAGNVSSGFGGPASSLSASPLSAYARTQGLGASTSTSLTA